MKRNLYCLIALFLIMVVSIAVGMGYYRRKTLEHYNNKTAEKRYTAVIVEPREHPALHFVLNNACENLSSDWNILVFNGEKNENFVNNIIQKISPEYRAIIKTITLPIQNLTIPEYNRLLTSKKFYDQIPTEIFLIFQTDSMICPNSNIQVDEFFEYDYVGAPWEHLNGTVGNGGFSLRRKSKMVEILEKCEYNGTDPEDVYFANACKDVTSRKPSREQAYRFSNEAKITKHSFGVHKCWNNPDFNEKIKTCPGLDELAKLNK